MIIIVSYISVGSLPTETKKTILRSGRDLLTLVALVRRDWHRVVVWLHAYAM